MDVQNEKFLDKLEDVEKILDKLEDTDRKEGAEKLYEVGDEQKIVENYQEDVQNVKFPEKLEDIEMILDKLENTEKELEEVVGVQKIDSSYQDIREKQRNRQKS